MITSKFESHPVYAGSKLFLPLADALEVPIDKVNFLITQIFAFFLSFIFRHILSSCNVSNNIRHIFLLFSGFSLGYFAFGYQIWNLLVLGMICYISMAMCNANIVHHVVLFISFIYLSYLHLIRQINDYGSYVLEITVPTMIVVQKLTSLAFSIHDGHMQKYEKLTPDQFRYAVYFIFLFPTLMSGPMYYFNDFIHFIQGETENEYKKCNSNKLPHYSIVVLQRLSLSISFVLLLLFVEPLYPISRLGDEEFLQKSSFIAILWYIFLSTTCARFKYYHAWKFGEAIAINSGLGLIKSEDQTRWQYISSVDIFGFEFANSFRACLNAWNITTQGWLRRIAYERVNKHKVMATYVLSAVWHGFYPGYYITFFSGGLLTEASRIARRKIRPYFQSSKYTSFLYDCLTFLSLKIILSYVVAPFILLEFNATYRLYSRLYFSGHILCIFFILLIPYIPSKHVKTA